MTQSMLLAVELVKLKGRCALSLMEWECRVCPALIRGQKTCVHEEAEQIALNYLAANYTEEELFEAFL